VGRIGGARPSDPCQHVGVPDEDPHRQDKIDLVVALIRALDNMDEINSVVRAPANAVSAKQALMAPPFSFTEVQAVYVLDIQVRRQTQAARQDLLAELQRLKSPDQ
jgi:DNA gyrase subunit A